MKKGNMKEFMEKLRLGAKTCGINITIRLLNLVSHIGAREVEEAVSLGLDIDTYGTSWKDDLRWWFEDKLDHLFVYCHDGSREEIAAVWDDEIPPAYMSERQKAEFNRYNHSNIIARCCSAGCHYVGLYASDYCPRCGKAVWIEVRFREQLPAHREFPSSINHPPSVAV